MAVNIGQLHTHLYYESSIWGALCLIILFARLFSKYTIRKTTRGFEIDDYVMVLTFCFYIAVVVVSNIFAIHDFLFIDSTQQLVSANNVKWTIINSKLCVVTEVTMLTCIWGVKCCLLILYNRLTTGLPQSIAVKIIAVYVAISYVLLLVLLLGVFCRPLDQYWSLTPTNSECLTYRKYFIAHVSLNVSSDLLMILVPWSFLATLTLQRTKKASLVVIFSLGIFVIIAACLTKYYSLTQPYNPHWEFWYVRESSTAVLVGNIPLCLPLLRKVVELMPKIDLPSWMSSSSKSRDAKSVESTRPSIYKGNEK